MFSFKAVVLLILLCTVPSLPAHPIGITPTCPAAQFTFPFTYDDVIRLLDAIESGEADETCSPEEFEKISRFLAFLAKLGAIADDDSKKAQLERDIAELLYRQREFLPCRSWVKQRWDEAREFVHDHKTGLIIGTAMALAGGAIFYAITAGAAAAAVEGCMPHEEPERPVSRPPSPAPPVEPMAMPTFQEVIQERLSSFKEELLEEELYAARIEENPQGPLAREVASLLAHETFDAIAELGSIIPHFRDEVAQASTFVADEIERAFGFSLFKTDDLLPSPINASEEYDHLVAKGHEKLDELFSSSLASHYTPEAKAKNPFNEFDLGILPPPNNLLGGGLSSARKILQAGQGTALLAEELGFTSREIAQLEKSGTLEVAVDDAFGNLVRDPANLRSWEIFNKVEAFLKPYRHQYISEIEVRELIHQAGGQTFPKPPGIPGNFKTKISRKGAGIVYEDPNNEYTSVRIMPGKPHSPWPHQREPYVVQMSDGKAFDKYGNRISQNAPEAHIPLNEFTYK